MEARLSRNKFGGGKEIPIILLTIPFPPICLGEEEERPSVSHLRFLVLVLDSFTSSGGLFSALNSKHLRVGSLVENGCQASGQKGTS